MDKFLKEPWPVSSQPKSFQNHIKTINEQNQNELNLALNRAKINEALNKVNEILNKPTTETQLSTVSEQVKLPNNGKLLNGKVFYLKVI